MSTKVNTNTEKKPSDMMMQYNFTKEQYKDCVVFFRVGDFYELFNEDALQMSKVLDLTLTGKDCGMEERAPMCGVPVKALDVYIQKALEKGYKLAICEQLSDPKESKGIVKRDVVRVITPGTIMEESLLDEHKNNFIMSIYASKNGNAISWCDISTGEFNVTELAQTDGTGKLNDIITMISPAEIICNAEAKNLETEILMLEHKTIPEFNAYKEQAYNLQNAIEILNSQFKTMSLKSFDLEDKPNAIKASGALLEYLNETQKRSLSHIDNLLVVRYSNYMHIDYQSRKNLELVSNARDGGKFGTLLWYLDKTNTSMGSRLLRKFIVEPLQSKAEIDIRQNGVEELFKNIVKREEIISYLKEINDIERLCGRISYNSLTPADCVSLKNSLKLLPKLKEVIGQFKSKALKTIYSNINEHLEVVDLLDHAIVDKGTPTNTKDGGFIKDGYSKELDELRYISTNSNQIIEQMAIEEQKATGIKNLRIGYNRVFGYYIEVTNSQKNLVPFRYIRKQTLANAERYVTEELTELEQKKVGSDEKAIKLEQQLFAELRLKLLDYLGAIKETAMYVAYLDALCSLATVAVKNNLVKPDIVDKDSPLQIIAGRHPIVEAISKSGFVPNDTLLDKDTNRTMIITGPNMAGKSTYMRQVAIIVLMAHIGSFVPAQSAQIPITDRIFTRIGATDDLAFGQSTFMVEMTEVANILRYATSNSLVLLDEIGRGTSTFDGLSIAWAVMEYISQHLVGKTLFSTHYHELTELEGNLPGVKNYNISVKELNGSIVFLRKILRGGANKSFGIEVASLAGLPKDVVVRAKEILRSLELADINNKVAEEADKQSENLVLKRKEREVINILNDTKIETLTPFEAISLVHDLKEKLKEE